MGKRAAVDILTPEARLERAKRTIAEGVSELVEARLSLADASNDWVDQYKSPLGKRRHLDLVRTGKLQGRKLGRRVLVRRVDLNAHIEREGLARGRPADEQDVVDVVDELLGARR